VLVIETTAARQLRSVLHTPGVRKSRHRRTFDRPARIERSALYALSHSACSMRRTMASLRTMAS
jgi:hypothetical protein